MTGGRKIGFMTAMYALGAFVAPLFVKYYLGIGGDWRILFITLFIGTVIAFAGITLWGRGKIEEAKGIKDSAGISGKFIFAGVFLLCVVMCIYVGYENGFAFFVDTLFTDALMSDYGKFALSLFWLVMIPSRALVGIYSKYARKILIASVIAIPLISAVISRADSGVIALVLCIPLGFACGAIYPGVLNILMEYCADKKATATGMITTATGIGGAIFTALTGIMGEKMGLRNAILALSGFFIISVVSVLCLREIKPNEVKS